MILELPSLKGETWVTRHLRVIFDGSELVTNCHQLTLTAEN
jgi:hypothetical protein